MAVEGKEFVAYQGEKFTIEWYFDSKGKSQAAEYADLLEEKHRVKLAELLAMMGEIGTIRNQQKFRHEGDQIYAFKPKPFRFLCFFFSGQKIIVTNGFMKKQDKLPSREKKRALKARDDYEKRTKEKNYYGKTEDDF